MSNQQAFQAVLIGDSNSGKTSVINRFISDHFSEEATSGEASRINNTKVGNFNVKWQLDDSSTGSEGRLMSIMTRYLRQKDVFFITFDLSARASFDHVEMWRTQVEKSAPNALFVLVGCKSDLGKGAVSSEEIENYRRLYQMQYYDTSALTGEGVNEMFHSVADTLLRKREADSFKADKTVRGHDAFHKGWMVKRGYRWPHRWQQRWFVLTDESLTYTKTDRDDNVLGTLAVPEIISMEEQGENGTFYSFNISTQSRTLELRCQTSNERTTWMQKLTDMVGIVPSQSITLTAVQPDLSRGEMVQTGTLIRTKDAVTVHYAKPSELATGNPKVDINRFWGVLKSIGNIDRNLVYNRGFTSFSIDEAALAIDKQTRDSIASRGIRCIPAVLMVHFQDTLDRFIIRQKVPLSPLQALKIMTTIVSGLEFLHGKQIVHTDVAMNNIGCTEQLTPRLRVVPSSRFLSGEVRHAKGPQGQPGYSAPESSDGKVWNTLVDMFAFGIICFEIVYQRSAFFYPGSAHEEGTPITPGLTPDPPEEASWGDLAKRQEMQTLLSRLTRADPTQRHVSTKAATILRRMIDEEEKAAETAAKKTLTEQKDEAGEKKKKKKKHKKKHKKKKAASDKADQEKPEGGDATESKNSDNGSAKKVNVDGKDEDENEDQGAEQHQHEQNGSSSEEGEE